MSIALAFSGAIASGKSSLSRAIAEALKWQRVAFGDYVRAVAEGRDLPETREMLQALGTSLIEEQGWEGFCRSVLQQAVWKPGEPIVVDGVRHVEAVATLRPLVFPSRLLLVHVAAPAALRSARLAARGVDLAAARAHDSHPTEAQVGTTLPELADLTVDGSRALDELTIDIVKWAVSVERRAGRPP